MKSFVGTLVASLYLRDSGSLKDRRSVLRSLETRLRKAGFSVAQVGPADFHKRAWIAAVCVSGTGSVASAMLETAERILLDARCEVVSVDSDMIELETEEEI